MLLRTNKSIWFKLFYLSSNLSFILRNFYWRRVFCNSSLQVYGQITIYSPENIKLGHNVTLNQGVVLNARDQLTIESDVRISQHVVISTTGLTKDISRQHTHQPITIKSNAWIGAGAIILPGVTIGRNSIVGAGAVVTKSVADDLIVVGVPAKPLFSKP